MPEDGPEAVIAVGAVLSLLAALNAAEGLRTWLGYVDPQPRRPSLVNLLFLVRESMRVFEDRSISVGYFGPRLESMVRPDAVDDK